MRLFCACGKKERFRSSGWLKRQLSLVFVFCKQTKQVAMLQKTSHETKTEILWTENKRSTATTTQVWSTAAAASCVCFCSAWTGNFLGIFASTVKICQTYSCLYGSWRWPSAYIQTGWRLQLKKTNASKKERNQRTSDFANTVISLSRSRLEWSKTNDVNKAGKCVS